ncbi:MAG: hypothetical protein L6R28_21155 [Planctomycetes bacterium]|nr:hypothetical protein [Planctomycetota bacterium]
MADIPVWGILIATAVLVAASIEAGFRMGAAAHRNSAGEKESPVSSIAGTVLGLGAFLLAFTFGIVSDRFDARKALVREEANAIRTAWLRSEFLPEADRTEAQRLYREYLDQRLRVIQSLISEDIIPDQIHVESRRIRNRLWSMAVAHARTDMNSDVAALYIESVNEIISIHALRVAIGLQARIPGGIWLALYLLTCLGMWCVGYQAGIAGSKRSWAKLILVISFSLVFAMIESLDRPGGFIQVSQQPLADLQKELAEPTSP